MKKKSFFLKPGSYFRAIRHELHDWQIVINTWNSQEFKDSILSDRNRCLATSNNFALEGTPQFFCNHLAP